MILQTIIPQSAWVAIRNYINNALSVNGLPSQSGNGGKFLSTDGTDALWTNEFIDVSNTATGATSVTINGVSGRAIFTGNILSNGFVSYTISNSSLSGFSSAIVSLKYSTGDSGNPFINYYDISGTDLIVKVFNNSGVSSTNGNIVIDFRLVG